MSEAHMRALMLLAGIEVHRAHRVENGYCTRACCADKPWWLVETQHGLVRVGWRKHVIHIDWESTPVRGDVTQDDVTKEESMVHAWGYGKAVEYLENFARLARRQAARAAEVGR